MTEEAAHYDTGGHWTFLQMGPDLKPRLRWVWPGRVLWIHVAIKNLAIACYPNEEPYPPGRWVKAMRVPWERMKPGVNWTHLYVLDEKYRNRNDKVAS